MPLRLANEARSPLQLAPLLGSLDRVEPLAASAAHLGAGGRATIGVLDAAKTTVVGSRKGWSTPTKALVGAGVGLELVSLFYLVRHLREDGRQDDAQPSSP